MSRFGGVPESAAQEHIINIKRYMRMQQYVPAELEIRRVEAL